MIFGSFRKDSHIFWARKICIGFLSDESEDSQSCGHNNGIASQFANGHGNSGNPYIASHKSQGDEQSISNDGKEREKSHPRPSSVNKPDGLVHLFFVNLEVFFNPFRFTNSPYPVAGKASKCVSGSSEECGPHRVKS